MEDRIPFAEEVPDIVQLAFTEIDRLPPGKRARILSRLHSGVIGRAVEMIPVDYDDPAADRSVRELSRTIAQGGTLVASTEINRAQY